MTAGESILTAFDSKQDIEKELRPMIIILGDS